MCSALGFLTALTTPRLRAEKSDITGIREGARLTEISCPGHVDTGDVWTLAFNEPIQADGSGNVTGTIAVKDASGNAAAVT